MRKLVLLGLALVMALGLWGCGSAAKIEFNAEDADLTYASDVIVENNPKNLGGWQSDAIVSFPLDLKEEKSYEVSLTFSRDANDSVELYFVGDSYDNEGTFAEAEATGGWDKYVTKSMGKVKLGPDDEFFEISGNTDIEQYIINLQKVVLTEVSE